MSDSGLLRLDGAVQHYGWGGYDYIPGLLGIENRERKPYAELWMGAHPKAPSWVEMDGGRVPLSELAPDLPYLFKVLDARQMLSIQAHPNKRQAEEGYARENAAGVPLDKRNYRDANHKPEVHVALTEFWMLHGFRPEEEIRETLESVPEFRPLPVRGVYEAVMTMPQEQVDAILEPLLVRLAERPPSSKSDPGFWALRAAREFPLPGGHRDRGIFSIYLLNLVHLRPGQGTYQPAGVLHAYLEGVNVELMANSDNVLRGGLTPKYVDVPELLRTLSFTNGPAAVLEGEPVSECERVYRTDAREFELSRIQLEPGQAYRGVAVGPEILIVLEGAARGQSFMALPGAEYTFESGTVLFKARQPN